MGFVQEKSIHAEALIAEYTETSEEVTLDSLSTQRMIRPFVTIKIGFNTKELVAVL